jgi:hypothetical protein
VAGGVEVKGQAFDLLELKRETALITKNYMHARILWRYLKQHEVDAVIVTKHAVQIHPRDVAKAEELMRNYAQERKDV